MIYRKGLHTLLRAISDQRSSCQGGCGWRIDTPTHNMRRKWRDMCLHMDCLRLVKFHGALDNEPLIEMYKQAHVMVVPSVL